MSLEKVKISQRLAKTHYSFEYFSGDISLNDTIIFTVDSDLTESSPQFTLTCISTGGPATTITWTRDSNIVTEGTETVLENNATANYHHNLTVTGRLEGLYMCIVSNDKYSDDSAQLNVQGISCVLCITC